MLKLKPAEVREIYGLKLWIASDARLSYEGSLLLRRLITHGHSSAVARLFRVSPRTVRDIWTRRTHRALCARAEAEWRDPFHADWAHWA